MKLYLLNIDLNVFLQVVAVQVEDQVVDKVKSVTDDDQWQLVSEFCFLCIKTVKEAVFEMTNKSSPPLQQMEVKFRIAQNF